MTSKYNLKDLLSKFNFFKLNILHLYVEDGIIIFLFKGNVMELNFNHINRYSTKQFLLNKATTCN